MSASSFIYTGLKGLSGEKRRMWGRPCSRRLQEVEEPFPCFLTAIFTPGEFQGKVREIDEREVALLGSLLNTILSVCHMWQTCLRLFLYL